MKHVLKAVTAVAVVCLGVGVASAKSPDARVHDPDKRVAGQTLGEWMADYWQWSLGGADPAESVIGDVVYLPIPNGPDLDEGDGVAMFTGHQEVTLYRGEAFVLPVIVWYVETYDPALGLPPDPYMPDACFDASLHPLGCDPTPNPAGKWSQAHVFVTLDGDRILGDGSDFYVGGTDFDEPVVYDQPTDYGSISAFGAQSIVFIGKPLSPGVHHLTNFGDYGPAGFFFNNDWTITVRPGRRPR